ncbi:hypothetical protein [Clostridium sp. JS66]|uniref:hypothetical protein n=1 Tax=Clostridium sp. JS66 TaxID=3064705 RepID=UPI00298DD83B|nr:hypothetical protein [Clostridium sp. JS66]WPC42326.1 hypothetical protein Q6H37_02330 [Clostridium sp. JS66]
MGYFAVNKSGVSVKLYTSLGFQTSKGYIQENERFVIDWICQGDGGCYGRVLHNPDGGGVVDGYFTLNTTSSPRHDNMDWRSKWSNFGFGIVYSPNVPGTPLSIMKIDKTVACYGSGGEFICYLAPGSNAYITPNSACGEHYKNCISAYGVYNIEHGRNIWGAYFIDTKINVQSGFDTAVYGNW